MLENILYLVCQHHCVMAHGPEFSVCAFRRQVHGLNEALFGKLHHGILRFLFYDRGMALPRIIGQPANGIKLQQARHRKGNNGHNGYHHGHYEYLALQA